MILVGFAEPRTARCVCMSASEPDVKKAPSTLGVPGLCSHSPTRRGAPWGPCLASISTFKALRLRVPHLYTRDPQRRACIAATRPRE